MKYLNSKMVKVEGKLRSDLLNALTTLGEMDADFSGANGPEYLWPNVDDKYNSNSEYLLDLLKCIESDKELIEQFVARWIGADSYYTEYSLNVIYDENGKAECISLATIS